MSNQQHILEEMSLSQIEDEIILYISKDYRYFSEKETRMLACNWARECLYLFEEVSADDLLPRIAIDTAQAFVEGTAKKISLEDLRAARQAAFESLKPLGEWSAAFDAVEAARVCCHKKAYVAARKASEFVAIAFAKIAKEGEKDVAERNARLRHLKDIKLLLLEKSL